MSTMLEVSSRLKSLRSARGWTQNDLAEELGVSKRAIEEWESPRGRPPRYLFLALAAIEAGLDPWAKA